MTFKKLHCLLNFITSFQTLRIFLCFVIFDPHAHQKYHPDIDIFGLVLIKVIEYQCQKYWTLVCPSKIFAKTIFIAKFYFEKIWMNKKASASEIQILKVWFTQRLEYIKLYLEFTLKNTGENFKSYLEQCNF